MLLRTFVIADNTELGLACLDWARFLIALDHPVRLASAGGPAEIMGDDVGRSPNPWATLRSYFATPLEDEYVNVVMTPPTMWDRLWAKRARRNVAIDVMPSDVIANHRFDAIILASRDARESWGSFHRMPALADQLERLRLIVVPQ